MEKPKEEPKVDVDSLTQTKAINPDLGLAPMPKPLKTTPDTSERYANPVGSKYMDFKKMMTEKKASNGFKQ